jgi:glycosyltransferase involved in cell wall biosynthesis
MNILQISAYCAEYGGNFASSLKALDDENLKVGNVTTYIFPACAKDKVWISDFFKGRKIFYLPLKLGRINPFIYYEVARIIVNEKIDLIHSHFELYDLATLIGIILGKKVVWHVHDSLNTKLIFSRELLKFIQYKLLSTKVDVIAISEDDLLRIKKLNQKCKVHQLKNAIDTSRIKKIERSSFRGAFLGFGWDVQRKGVDIMLGALREVHEMGFDFKFILNCNESTFENKAYLVHDEDFVWLKITYPTNDINELYAESDVLISASRDETFSYAVCEALYSGMLVLSSDIVGLSWAKSFPTVRFFESEKVSELRDLIIELITNHRSSNDEIYASRELIDSQFSISNWANEVIRIYYS